MKIVHYIGFCLLVIGGLNWGLVGAFHFNLVEKIFGTGSLTTIIYVLVGLSAVYIGVTHPKDCRVCKGDGSKGMSM